MAGSVNYLLDPIILRYTKHRLISYYEMKDAKQEKYFDIIKSYGKNLFLDCGAPSLYNALVKTSSGKNIMGSHAKHRSKDDHSYIEDEKYSQYRDNYISFLKKSSYKIYSNLDVINHPMFTWKNQRYLEKKGVKPLPIFHLGCDLKWLKRYIDKGYKHICLGGIVPEPPPRTIPILDYIWSEYLTDSKGMPLAKVHGFGITIPKLIHRYPWYSTDSTAWIKNSAYGVIHMPQLTKNKWDYTRTPFRLYVSSRNNRKSSMTSIRDISKTDKNALARYLDENGFKFGKSEFKEVDESYKLKEGEYWAEKGKKVEIVIEEGIINHYLSRAELNLKYYKTLEQSVPEWPHPFRKKGIQRLGLV